MLFSYLCLDSLQISKNILYIWRIIKVFLSTHMITQLFWTQTLIEYFCGRLRFLGSNASFKSRQRPKKAKNTRKFIIHRKITQIYHLYLSPVENRLVESSWDIRHTGNSEAYLVPSIKWMPCFEVSMVFASGRPLGFLLPSFCRVFGLRNLRCFSSTLPDSNNSKINRHSTKYYKVQPPKMRLQPA